VSSLFRPTKSTGVVLSCLFVPALLGQQGTQSGGTNNQQDPLADIARASLSASCNANTNASQLQAAQDRLSRLQAAKRDAQGSLADVSDLSGAGASLSNWSAALGAAQVLQGLSDGFMSVASLLTGSKGNDLYNVAKSGANCANGAVTDTVSPAECLNSVAEATAELKGGAGSLIRVAAAGAATGANLAEKKSVDTAASALSAAPALIGGRIGNPAAGFGRGAVAVDAVANGDVPKALEYIPKTIGKFVADETLGKAFDTVGDVVKAAVTTANGIDNLSSADASGGNLNTVTSSAYNLIAANVMKLSAKINDTQKEVDRLAQCQQQLAAPAADVLDTLGPLLADPSGTGASGGNSAMLKKLADSMAETSSPSAGANVQLPQIDPASVPSQGQSLGNSLLNVLSSQLPSTVIPNSKIGNAGVQGVGTGSAPFNWCAQGSITTFCIQHGLSTQQKPAPPPPLVSQPGCKSDGSGASCGVH
jgi:hypothetical protein